MEARILRLKDVEALLQIHKSTIYRLVKQKRMPRPIRLGPNSVGFLKSEIDEWIATRPRAGTDSADS